MSKEKDYVYQVAIVGCGGISKMHLKGIEESSKCQLVSICDIDVELAKEKAKMYGVNYTDSFDEILANDNIDAVHILTPHYLHTKMAEKAIKAGKHVVLEKPIGINSQEIISFAKRYKNSEYKIGEVFQNRYNNTSKKAKSLIESGQLGSFISCRGTVAWDRKEDYYTNSDWHGVKAKEGGGAFLSQAIHTVDLVRWLCGDVVQCKGHIDNIKSPYTECEDTGLLTMIHKNGGVSNILATINHGIDSPIELELVFEKGLLRFDKNVLYIAKDDNYEVVIRDNTNTTAKIYWGTSHIEYIDCFYGSLVQNNNVEVPLEDGIKTDQIIWALYESSLKGETVAITPID